jgi:hypothetical protein
MFDINKNDVLKQLGFFSRKTIASPDLEHLIDDEINSAKSILIPKKIIKMCQLTIIDESTLVICNNFNITSKSLVLRLSGCNHVYLFVITVGDRITSKANEYAKKGEITKAAIADAIGSVAVEFYADNVNEQIINTCKKAGYVTAKRFSPGYGDWSIKDQDRLLNILDAGLIQVKLNKSYQMFPEKSISALIGVMVSNPK